MADESENSLDKAEESGKMFTLKKWNAVAMWSWDVECDICAICRVQVMGKMAILGLFLHNFVDSSYKVRGMQMKRF